MRIELHPTRFGLDQGRRVIHVDLGQLVAEYMRVKYRPDGPATLALFQQ